MDSDLHVAVTAPPRHPEDPRSLKVRWDHNETVDETVEALRMTARAFPAIPPDVFHLNLRSRRNFSASFTRSRLSTVPVE